MRRNWAVVWTIATFGCHAASAPADGPMADAPADVAIDAGVSPWLAPTGAPLAGVTLADGWQDLRALSPPLEIAGGWTDSLFAAPGGRQLIYAYEETDFSAFFISHGVTQTVTGPPLAGLSPITFKMFEADLGADDWHVTPHPINSPDPNLVEAAPAINESGDVIVFSEYTLPSGHARLYSASHTGNTWTSPVALPINSASCNDDNAKVVGELATGMTIYFESTRAEDAGTSASCAGRKLYTATYANGTFSPVTAIAGISTATSDDSQPFATLDQATLYWTGIRDVGYGVFTATRQPDGSFADIHVIASPTTTTESAGNVVLIGEASVVDLAEGSLLYMMCGLAMNTHGGDTFNDADYIQLEPCVARRPR